MRIDVRPAAGDILQEAFVCVVAADVITHARKRSMMAELAALKALRGCPPAACAGCGLRRDCEARVIEIIGASEPAACDGGRGDQDGGRGDEREPC